MIETPNGPITEEELISMLPEGVDTTPQVYMPTPSDLRIAGANPKGFVPAQREMYVEHIDYYFDVQVGSAILGLKPEEKDELYQMFTDYAVVIKKVFAVKMPIIEHILGNPWPPEEIINDPEHQHIHCGSIDDCLIIADYEEWKANKPK